MRSRSRAIVILSLLFGYVLLQFIWWEVLLVRQNNRLAEEKQRLLEVSTMNERTLLAEIEELHRKKRNQTYMIVGEGTVFLLLLLFGIHKIRKGINREETLARQQKNFFLSVTHELKTPIAATKLQLQTLRRKDLDRATLESLLAKAIAETDRLNVLIDNILLASSFEAGNFSLKKEPINVSRLLEDVVGRYYQPQLASGQLNLQVDDAINLQTDPLVFPSIVTNLVDNAFKYSDGTPKVNVALRRSEQSVLLTVADEGKGIIEEEKQKIFTKFYRSENEEIRSARGTGLGLYIVRYLCGLHQAPVRVYDNKPKGTIFEVRFANVS